MKPIYAKPKKIPTIPLSHPLEASTTATNHPTGDAFFKNQIPTVSPQYDADVKTGRALELGADNDLAIPIHHTLGADEDATLVVATECTASGTADNFTLTTPSTSSALNGRYLDFQGLPSYTENKAILYTFNASIVTNTTSVVGYYSGTEWIRFDTPIPIVNGENKIQLSNRTSNTSWRMTLSEDANDAEIEITSMVIQEITSMANSFLTYHDIANDEIIQIGNAVDGGSSKEYVDCSDFSCSDGWVLKSSNTTISGGQLIIDTHIDNGWYNNATQTLDIDLTKTYILEIDVAEIDDVLYVRIGNDINGGVNGEVGITSPGVHTVEYSNRADNTLLMIEDRHGLPCRAVINSISVKESLPTSTEYILNDATVNNILTHKEALDIASLANIQAEPNLLAELGINGSAPGVNVVLDGDDVYKPCSEVSGAYVVDQRAGYGAQGYNGTMTETQANGALTDLTNGDWNYTSTSNTTGNDISFMGNDIVSENGVPVVLSFNATIHEDKGISFNRYYDGSQFITISPSFVIHDGANSLILAAGDPLFQIISLYPQTETEANVDFRDIEIREATASEIADYDASIRLTNQQKGLQTTALLLDNAGVPESYNNTSNTARVYNDTEISTRFKPSIARYSIEEESSGLMQDFGADRFIELNSTGSFVTDTVIDGGYKFVITTGSTIINSNIAFSVSGTAPTPYDAITFNAVIHSGSLTFTHYHDGSDYVPLEQEHTVTNGRNIMIVPPRLSNTNRVISSDQTPTYEIDMTDIRIEGLTTKTQRTERRLLTHDDAIPENKYYIGTDGGAMVEQAVVPPLPDPNTTINLGNTCVIGYPDTITERSADFDVHSEVIVP